MTPWTEVFTIMTKNLPKLGGISEQVEDEIAAAALAVGASHAGVKAIRLLRRRLRADVGAARARGDDGDSRRPR